MCVEHLTQESIEEVKSILKATQRLGSLYRNQGMLKEAEKMYQCALKGREKVLGLGHISTLRTVHSLSLLYADQGRLKEAEEEMLQRALDGYKKAVGVGSYINS